MSRSPRKNPRLAKGNNEAAPETEKPKLLGSPIRTSRSRTCYRQFQWRGEIYSLGDTILLESDEYKDFVAIVEEIFFQPGGGGRYETEDMSFMICCRWFYQNYDLRARGLQKKSREGIMQHENQLYWSFHTDLNAISVIKGHCTVHWVCSGVLPKKVMHPHSTRLS